MQINPTTGSVNPYTIADLKENEKDSQDFKEKIKSGVECDLVRVVLADSISGSP